MPDHRQLNIAIELVPAYETGRIREHRPMVTASMQLPFYWLPSLTVAAPDEWEAVARLLDATARAMREAYAPGPRREAS